MINMNNNLFCTVFSVNNIYGKSESWVHVSSLNDEATANHQMDVFCLNHNINSFSNAFIIPEPVFNAVLLPVIREIREVLNEANDVAIIQPESSYEMIPESWIETDDDCHQCVKKTGKDIYRFVQIVQRSDIEDDKKCYVITSEVSVEYLLTCTDECYAEICCDMLSGYGYDPFLTTEYENEIEHLKLIVGEIRKIYNDDYKRIIAECIFEQCEVGNPDECIISPKYPVTWDEAVSKANEYMWELEG